MRSGCLLPQPRSELLPEPLTPQASPRRPCVLLHTLWGPALNGEDLITGIRVRATSVRDEEKQVLKLQEASSEENTLETLRSKL